MAKAGPDAEGVSGISRVTPATIANVCSARIVVSPVASSFPNVSRRSIATRSPRAIRTRYSSSSPVAPTMPSSSPKAAKMKSLPT